ncbi:MAG TPA: hypothetical protein VGO93_12535 [Candidatus Xenobia bacterium]|jgi:hypothetical protein
MKALALYPLLKTPRGLEPGEFEQAMLHFDGQELRIECPDYALRTRLREIFSTPLRVRRPVGTAPDVVAWEVHELQPDTDEFFAEACLQLHRHGLAVKAV